MICQSMLTGQPLHCPEMLMRIMAMQPALRHMHTRSI